MRLHTLELAQVLLTNSAEKMQLLVFSHASFQLPLSIATSNHTDVIKALISGHVWTSRGIGCALDISITFNGKHLNQAQRVKLLEALGRHMRDNQVSHSSEDINITLTPCSSGHSYP